jgi:hypothetical protein
VIVVPDYRGHRFDVEAVAVDGRWNAAVRIRRILSDEKPHRETVACLKLTPEHAERNAEIWARRWIGSQELKRCGGLSSCASDAARR